MSYSTIWKFEVTGKAPRNPWFIETIQHALEEAGVEFTNVDGPGVKLAPHVVD